MQHVTQKHVTHSLLLLLGLCAASLAVLTGFAAPARATAPEWRRYFGSPSQEDFPIQVVTDSTRSVIVLGTTSRSNTHKDFRVLKYSPSGKLLWTRRYNGTGNDDDYGVAVGVDAADNIYVTGTSASSTTGYDIVTLKYSPDGTELWRRRFNSGGTTDYADALKVSRAGDVYVTGKVNSSSSRAIICTLKYDPNGNKLWEREFDIDNTISSPEITGYSIGGLALDQNGDAYITGEVGYYYYNDGDYIYASQVNVIKYLPNGTQAWTRVLATGYEGDVFPLLATDTDGNVIVGLIPDSGFITIYKFSPKGQILWQSYSRIPGIDSALETLSVDSAGNIIAAGYYGYFDESDGSGERYHIAITKLDPNGTQVWTKIDTTIYSSYFPYGLALDAGGNAFLTGTSTSLAGKESTVTQKYAADDGSLLWSDAQDPGGNTASRGVTVDKTGAAITIATKPGGHGFDDFVIFKYAP